MHFFAILLAQSLKLTLNTHLSHIMYHSCFAGQYNAYKRTKYYHLRTCHDSVDIVKKRILKCDLMRTLTHSNNLFMFLCDMTLKLDTTGYPGKTVTLDTLMTVSL